MDGPAVAFKAATVGSGGLEAPGVEALANPRPLRAQALDVDGRVLLRAFFGGWGCLMPYRRYLRGLLLADRFERDTPRVRAVSDEARARARLYENSSFAERMSAAQVTDPPRKKAA